MSHHITEDNGEPYDIDNEDHDTLFQAFVTGHLNPEPALRGLARHYKDIDGLIADLEIGREVIRNMIETVVAVVPERKATAAGYDIAIVASGESVSWDTKALDSLIASLADTGDVGMMRVASQIGLARTVSRGSSLRITKRKDG